MVKKEPLTIEMEAMLAGWLSNMRLVTAFLLGYATFLWFSELVELWPCDFSITFRNARITYQRVWPSFSYVSKFS